MGWSDEGIAFLQRLIQTPSLPGHEASVAALVEAEMVRTGFDEVSRDEAGNVIGRIRGRGEAPALLFNTHLDHVDPGDPSGWPAGRGPYSGTIQDGRLWGRGASDIKGPLAAQLYGLAALKRKGTRPPGDVYLATTVQEEIGGVGARHLAGRFRTITPLVVVGEPSGNQLRRGHRGRAELIVHLRGRSVHASAPERGTNPLFALGRFLDELEELQMVVDDELGAATLAPTLIRSDQQSANVTPGELWLTIDWRTVPAEEDEVVRDRLAALLAHVLEGDEAGEVRLRRFVARSYTGLEMEMEAGMPAYRLAADDPAVRAAESLLSTHTGREERATLWRFATDGGHFAEVGMKVIGIAPGDEKIVHTNRERIVLEEWAEGVEINRMLAEAWPARVAREMTA